MAHDMREIKSIHFDGTQNGKIEIAVISEPYGEGSASVASIGVFLDEKSDEPDWKVHIPKSNIDEVVEALKISKSLL